MLLFLALIFDIKTDKVPNVLILCGYLTGMLNLVIKYGGFGVLRCILIIAVVWLCFMPVYVFGGLGGGDCKLLAWPALFLESGLLKCYFLIFLCGGVIALYRLFVNKKKTFHFTAAAFLGVIILFIGEVLKVV